MSDLEFTVIVAGLFISAFIALFTYSIYVLDRQHKEMSKRIWDAIQNLENMQRNTNVVPIISKHDTKSVFCHQLFIDTVADYYKRWMIPSVEIDRYVKQVSSGVPVSTCTFIILCNEMGISPINFFKPRK